MEPPVSSAQRRGRKRRRKFEKNAAVVHEPGRRLKKRAIDIRGVALVGRYVLKEFGGDGLFLGKIVSYESGLYRIDYEDGDCEDLDSGEVRQFLTEDECVDGEVLKRRMKLDEYLESKKEKMDVPQNGDKADVKGGTNGVESLTSNGFLDGAEMANGEADGNEIDDDVDSCSDLSEHSQGLDLGTVNEVPKIPPPELPPSSETIGLPEDLVPYLFSVYVFLRSFSVNLFLSPFTLEDFVACLKCTAPNNLLDAIHVVLLRMIRRHLETLSSDGSTEALKCLRVIDWTLLDMLTWPVYIVHYFMEMKDLNGVEWKSFYCDVIEKDYYVVAVGMKLKVLQILCDDALESAEIRDELDTREQIEVGMTLDEDPGAPPENGLTRVPHRHPKLSFPKDSGKSVPASNPSSTGEGGCDGSETAAADEDRNSDECRLCGMDGTLLCCDGCPSAYHSRCIGVSKMFIPEGPWLCPECSLSKLGPPITVGTSLRGAEVFGTDTYGQVFMGTCNHLLVHATSEDTVPVVRYYNHTNIPTVLRALNSCTQHAALYSGICYSIIKYWGIPEDVLPLPHEVQASIGLDHQKEEASIPSTFHPIVKNGTVEGIRKESTVDNMVGSSDEKGIRKSGVDEISMNSSSKQAGFANVPTNPDAAAGQNCPDVVTHGIPENAVGDSSLSSASVVLSGLTNQALNDGSNLKDRVSNPSGQITSGSGGNKNGGPLVLKFPLKKEGSNGVRTSDQNSKASCLSAGSSFKPHAYINSYVHGEFAASAAANLAILSSEENRASETRVLDPRKALSASISLQMKAFSSAAVRFFWPSTERKLVEVPRERCGWCLSCQGAAASRKACLLNGAALNATRVATKFFSGLRLSMNAECSLYSIAMYTLYMEESLHGLLVGPFQSANYRSQWRKQVELSSSCKEIKARLLELEGSLRTISLSGDWIKLVDGGSVEPSTIQTTVATSAQKRGPGRPSSQTTFAAGSTQRRGGPGRPPRKRLCSSEVTSDDSTESSNDFNWWCGRKYSKLKFKRGILPRAMLRKAARLGGRRKITGLHYADSSDVPKISRQLIWRAAVESSKNASHLALQVRYLDHYVRWSDLLRPEQSPQDAKGLDSEASAFRNAFICDKRAAENKVMYGVVFGHQKHLPTRLMKSIIGGKEETQDGKEKYWLLEARIPLYLIKEYEQKLPEKDESTFSNKPSCNLSSLQKKQLKDSRKDILEYLARKRDNMGVWCSCTSCCVDIVVKNAVKCSACEGYCHKECTMSSTIQAGEDAEYVVTCKSCVHARTAAQNKKVESPTSPLALQGQEYPNVSLAASGVKQKHNGKQSLPARTPESISNLNGKQQLPVGAPSVGVKAVSSKKKGKKSLSISDMKQPSANSNTNSNQRRKLCSLGLIWKKNRKNEPEESGIEFRRNNIIRKGNPDNMDVSNVNCRLCQKGYDPSFTFIHCDKCNCWYHAESVKLDESRLSDLLGFKCCKCRRIKIPTCRAGEEPLERSDALSELGKEAETPDGQYAYGSMSEHTESSIPLTPMTPMEDDVYIQLDDPFLSSIQDEDFPEFAPEVSINWETHSAAGPQKLPVRRQNLKQEEDSDRLAPDNLPEPEPQPPLPLESVGISEWDIPTGAEDEMQFDYENFNYEDAEFEPQTYFSFTELLATDDGSQPGVDAPENMPEAWENWAAGETSQGNNFDQLELEPFRSYNNGQAELPMVPAPAIECRHCSKTDPSPDLVCQTCGLQIHSHCSPWEEEAPQEDGWKCGGCRVWK